MHIASIAGACAQSHTLVAGGLLLQGGGLQVTKKVRKDLLDLIMIWGLPPAPGAEDAATQPAPTAAGEGDFDWDSWSGASGLTPALRKVHQQQELTLVLRVRRLLSWCESLIGYGLSVRG